MPWIAGGSATQFLGEHLPNPEFSLWLERGADDLGRGRRDRMIERAGRSCREHLHCCQLAGAPHCFFRQLQRQRQQETADPIFEQIAIREPLEQRVPVMLMTVDQTWQDYAPRDVDDFIKVRCFW